MGKHKNLVSGIGSTKQTISYYDNWANNYDKTLKKWGYQAPSKTSNILKSYLIYQPKNILDLACGTGLFAQEIATIYSKFTIDGIDISKKIISQARIKKIYRKIYCFDFNKKILIDIKYDLIACIGAMTYSKDPKKLILDTHNLTKHKGYFIFTHRADLWKKQGFDKLLISLSKKWKVVHVSRPVLYLPNNKDFIDKIKIKIVLLRSC